MYKLSVCIYLTHVLFDARQKSYEFKSLVKFGSYQKNSKSPFVGLFLENHTVSNFPIRIPLYANLDFHKKMLFSQICSNGHMRAKRVPRASERASRACEPGAIFANQAKRSLRKSSKPSKLSIVWASEASFASEWAWRSLRKSSKPSKSSKWAS